MTPINPALALLSARLFTAVALDPRTPSLAKLRDYAHGRQFGPNGEYWRGRVPADGTKDEVRKLYTQDDQIGPCLGRIVSGILGKDFEWDANRAGAGVAEDPSLEPIEHDLTTWHHEAHLHNVFLDALLQALWAGLSTLRIYIPSEYDDLQQGSLPTLADALERIHIHALDATQAGPIRDEHGREVGYYYRWTEARDGKPIGLVELHTPTEVTRYRLNSGKLELDAEPRSNPLYDPLRLRRPRYLMHALERDGGSAITSSILDLQDALNEELTGMKRNGQTAGFRSIITTNAEEPTDDDGKPIPWTMGPARVINLNGVAEKGTREKPESFATPGVTIVEPVNPDTFIKAANEYRTGILAAFDQTWTEAAYKAVSGESKKESRAAFEKRLELEAPAVAQAIRWALTTALDLARWLTASPPEPCDFEPRLFLDISRGDLETYKAQLDGLDKGAASLESVVASNPAVTDEAQELARLEAAREARKAEAAQRDQDLAAALATVTP